MTRAAYSHKDMRRDAAMQASASLICDVTRTLSVLSLTSTADKRRAYLRG